MIESFVDLTYRGLSLGRRVKLTSVSAGTGYLETPAPMPVGTTIALATDEGLTLVAVVRAVHEQVGGSEQVPGMLVAPGLDDAEHAAWWTARIAPERPDPPAPAPAEPPRTITVRPRSRTIPEPLVMATPADEIGAGGRTIAMTAVIPDEPVPPEPEQGGATQVMDAIDPELLAQLLGPGGVGPTDKIPTLREDERLPSDRIALATTGRHAVIDDGRATSVMDVIDPLALGLDASGFPVTDDEVDAGAEAEAAPTKKGAIGAAKKTRKKKPK